MSALSDFYENKIADWFYRGVAFTPPATLYVGLHTADPTDVTATALTTEVPEFTGATPAVATGYGRQPITQAQWAAAVDGRVSSLIVITFQTAAAPWGTVTWLSLWDAATGGNLVKRGLAPSARTVGTGEVYRISAGNLVGGFR